MGNSTQHLSGHERGVLERKFWEFHLANREVYKALLHFARQWRDRYGPDSVCGIKSLYERARWEKWFPRLDDNPPPKLSNNHTAFYARLIMERNPDLEGLFRLKRQRVQSTIGPQNETLESSEHIAENVGHQFGLLVTRTEDPL